MISIMGKMFFSKSESAFLLIALGIGYIVCYLANREERTMRKAGLTIGIFIIVASSCLLLSKLAWRLRTCFREKCPLTYIVPKALVK